MSNETTTQPSVTEAQIQSVMTTISDKLGGVFVTPSAIEPILEGMVNENNTLAPIANAVWDIAQRMHKQAGEAVTMVAMQQAMIEELRIQRAQAVSDAHDAGYQIGFDEGLDVVSDSSSEWMFTFTLGVADNEIEGLTDIQIETFADIFYEGNLDDTARQMLRDLILYVSQQYETDMGEVEF